MFQLEKYKGERSRYNCPACNVRHSFARYVDTATGEYLAPDCGRCNRDSKCGYHYTPKDYFNENPDSKFNSGKPKSFASSQNRSQPPAAKPSIKPDYIKPEILQKTLTNFEKNSFVQFLLNLFPDDAPLVWQAIESYSIGTTREGKTVFWQIDQKGQIRTGKIIAYDSASGKRRKDIPPTWAHYELKRAGLLKADYNLQQCFFGQQLLADGRPAAIVEAEKTAVIASICFPDLVWLAVGAKLNLKAEKLKMLGNRKIILYPDADGFAQWREVALFARRMRLTVSVSSVIEKLATDEQRANGYDLADYLIDEQRRINKHNLAAELQNTFEHVEGVNLGKFNLQFDSVLSNDLKSNYSKPENTGRLVFDIAQAKAA